MARGDLLRVLADSPTEAEPLPNDNRGTVLITGASSGIGLALARLFARDGFPLVLTARNEQRLGAIAAELRAHGDAPIAIIAADLTLADDVERLLRTVQESGTVIDILVNNAGYGGAGSFAKTELEDELAMIALNISTLTQITKRLLPPMLARGHGRILNVASIAAFQPGPYMSVYYATKAYVLSFSEAIAEEVKGSGVTVTTLCPGPTETGFASRARMRAFRVAGGRFPGIVTDAGAVAAAGYRGLFRGDRIVIPGLASKAAALAVRFLPRKLVTRIGAAWNRGRCYQGCSSP